MSASPDNAALPLLHMRGIYKTFGKVAVLRDVSLRCEAGQVHAICGENGAGKSTLMKVLSGVYAPDAGEILIEGSPHHFASPRQAEACGIAIIHQELTLLPHRTVAQNLCLGHEPTRWGMLDRSAMQQGACAALARLGCAIDPDTECRHLSVAEQQMVEIARAVARQARILVLDEPTSVLDTAESRKLFALIAELRQHGVAILYISHRMAEVVALADHVSVLKDGELTGVMTAKDASTERIVRLMVGRELGDFYPPQAAHEPGDDIYVVEDGGTDRLSDIHLRLRAGEIVGIAGLEDSGKTDLARTIVGDEHWHRGRVRTWDGRGAARHPREAAQRGMAFIPDDRKRAGLGLCQSVKDNAALTLRSLAAALARATHHLDTVLQRVAVRAAHPDTPVGELSGGNQQKVLIARWMARKPKLWIVCEPTRGIDVGAKAAIYQLLRADADAGNAVLVVSSDMMELIGLCDRLYVMAQGRIVAHLPRGASEEDIMAHAVHHPHTVAGGKP